MPLQQADRIYATNAIPERARKLGGQSLHSISDISRGQRHKDNNAIKAEPNEILPELCRDKEQLTQFLRATHKSATPITMLPRESD